MRFKRLGKLKISLVINELGSITIKGGAYFYLASKQ